MAGHVQATNHIVAGCKANHISASTLEGVDNKEECIAAGFPELPLPASKCHVTAYCKTMGGKLLS